MIYINEPNNDYKTYDEVVEAAVGGGVDRKRVYIYLAALGVKSVSARIISGDGVDYLEPVKLAIKNKQLVTKVSVCKSCKGLVFNG